MKEMKPTTKATLALPLAIAVIAGTLAFLATHPIVVVFLLGVPAVLGILGSLWYSLYVMFGGNPE
jgi:hypothetical protein